MNARIFALTGSLLLVTVLGGLTIYVIATTGIDILGIISLAIVGLFGFGVVGAILNPPGK
jgi:hypothetical protein